MKFHDATPETVKDRLRRYGCMCRWCGNRSGRDFHHIQPESVGGSDKWSNLIWVCEVCHTLLDEFCLAHWNDPEQVERMNELRSSSIEAEFQHVEGTINKRRSQEQWNYANIFEMGKEGKIDEQPRSADIIWRDLLDTKKHMKVDAFLCYDYLKKFSVHQNQTVCAFTHADGPLVIAAPSLRALVEKVEELQTQQQAEEQPMTPEESRAQYEEGEQAASEDYQIYKQMEDEFFHRIFRPS
jgi:hypothetical protein